MSVPRAGQGDRAGRFGARRQHRTETLKGRDVSMTRRTLLMLMIVVGVVGILGAIKTLQIQAAIAQASSFAPPPEAVTTIKVRAEEWPASLSAIGTVHAVRGVTVSADLPGVVESITFESGRPVPEGEVLVRLDTRQERAQLAAAEAQRDLLRLNLDRARGLVSQGIVAQADLDRATAEHQQAEARVGEIRATIDRKTIRAPFSGVLGIRQVNLGQYLNAGDPIVPLQSLDPDLRELRRAAAAAGAGARGQRGPGDDRGPARGRGRGPGHGHRLGGGRGHAQRPGPGHARRTRGAGCAPACSCRRGSWSARRAPSWRCRPRRSATRRTATRSSSSAR